MSRLVSVSVLLLIWGCGDEDETACDTEATLRDYTGLDGCAFVLVLESGQILEMGDFDEEPDFAFEDGMKIRISYVEMSDVVSICMVGPIVKVTCMGRR